MNKIPENINKIDKIEKKIDQNRNTIIEQKEMLDFLIKEENVQELTSALMQLLTNPKSFPESLKRGLLENTLYNPTFQQEIKTKIYNNQQLSLVQIQLLYLQAHLDLECFPKPILDMSPLQRFQGYDPIQRYGEGIFLNYLTQKYKNGKFDNGKTTKVGQNYFSSLIEKDLNHNINLPFINVKNGVTNHDFYTLLEWAQKNYPAEYRNRQQKAEVKHGAQEKRFYNDNENSFRNDYVRYEDFLFALEKYSELLNQKHNQVWKEAGYPNQETFLKQCELAQECYRFIDTKTKEKFPHIGKILTKLSEYHQKSESLKRKNFKDAKALQRIEQKYNQFSQEAKPIYHKIDTINKSLNVTPNSGEKAKLFFQNILNLTTYQEELKLLQKKYNSQEMIQYNVYLKSQQQLLQRYGVENIQKWQQEVQTYQEVVKNWKIGGYADVDFDKFEKYSQRYQKENLADAFRVLGTLQGVLIPSGGMDSAPSNFPIKGIMLHEQKKQQQKKEIDAYWAKMKTNIPVIYHVANAGSSIWNAFVEGIGSIAKTIALLKKPGMSDEGRRAAIEDMQQRLDRLSFDKSSAQKESVYDMQTGEINLNRDNGVSIVSSSTVHMLMLVYGGGGIAKGLTHAGGKLATTMGISVLNGAGLVTSSMLMSLGNSFDEALQAGMQSSEAFSYSVFSASMQSGLELISPNKLLLGQGSNLAKGMIKEMCKSKSKQSLVQLGKLVLKMTGKEVVEENLQEAMQLAAGNLVNEWANDRWGTDLPSDWSWKNFTATAMITTLTTGITTGTSSSMQLGSSTHNTDILRQHIQNSQELRSDVLQVIDLALAGKISLDISQQQLIELKNTLGQPVNNSEYFEGKKSKFGLSESISRSNSQLMDQILMQLDLTNPSEQLNKLRTTINQQYLSVTGKELFLTDDQLFSLLDAHQQDGELGALTFGELKKKVGRLSETIPDPQIRRFLLEAGFSGKEASWYSDRQRQIMRTTTEEKFSWDQEGGGNEILNHFLYEALWNKTYESDYSNLNLKNISECRLFLWRFFYPNGTINDSKKFELNDYKSNFQRRSNILGLILQMEKNFPNLTDTKKIEYFGFNGRDWNRWIADIKMTLQREIETEARKIKTQFGHITEKNNYSDVSLTEHIQNQLHKFSSYYSSKILPSILSRLDSDIQRQVLEMLPSPDSLLSKNYGEVTSTYEEERKNIFQDQVSKLFSAYPELKEIGSEGEYLNYLISKNKRGLIFYHVTKADHTFDQFRQIPYDGLLRDNEMYGRGIYFSGSNHGASFSGKLKESILKHPLFCFAVINNPTRYIETKGEIGQHRYEKHGFDSYFPELNYSPEKYPILPDALLASNPVLREYFEKDDRNSFQYQRGNIYEEIITAQKQGNHGLDIVVINNPNAIEILGSKKDQEAFKVYKEKQGKNGIEAIRDQITYPTLDTSAKEILEYAKINQEAIIKAYKQKFGNIVNPDDFRDLVGGEIGIDANKTHEAASYLADTYFEKLLEENRGKGNNTIKFLAGGPGSGKSSISSISPNNDYAAVLDGTLKTYTNAERNIERALSLGYNVRVEFVFRDMNEAFINGVLKRTISQNQSLVHVTGELGLGRTVPLHIFEKSHNGARETILKLYNKYGPNVVKIFGGSDKNLDLGNGILQKTRTENGIPPFVYEYDKGYATNLFAENEFEKERSILAIQEAYLSGKITEKQKLELLGE